MRTKLAAALAALAGLGVLAPVAAHAQTSTEVDYRISGQLSARWTTAGGERGTLTQRLSQAGELSYDTSGSSGSGSSFEIGGSTGGEAVVRVERDLADGAVARCVDAPRSVPGIEFEPVSRNRVDVGFAGERFSFLRPPELSAARCAGPVTADLVPLLPSGRFDLRRARRGPMKLRLRATRPFQAGGVSGELFSNAVIRLSRARVVRSGGRRAVARRAQSSYLVTDVEGTLTMDFAGGAEPACRLLDACGAGGSIAVSFAKPEGGVDLDPRGEGSQSPFEVDATAASRTARVDGPACGDTATHRTRLAVSASRARGGILVELRSSDGPDLWRTRCAGPGEQDVDGEVIAAAVVPRRDLAGPVVGVTLRADRVLRGAPFTGTVRGELALSMELS